jgi:hypothetical protein
MARVRDGKPTVRHAVVGLLGLLVVAAATAHAEHDHSQHHPAAEEDVQSFKASLGVLAATYRSPLYEGDYQGGTLGAAYARGRFEVGVMATAYQIDRNGKTYRGVGDVMVHGAAQLFTRGDFSAGAHFMVMAPTGDAMRGLGMGHWMSMPAAWSSFATSIVTLSGSLGYARGSGSANAHAEHGGGGAWPLVEPMSFSEITYDASAMFPVASSLSVGARLLGAFPTDDDARAIGAARVSWRAGRIETAAEAQAGIAGDPVRMRGLVSTSMTF